MMSLVVSPTKWISLTFPMLKPLIERVQPPQAPKCKHTWQKRSGVSGRYLYLDEIYAHDEAKQDDYQVGTILTSRRIFMVSD
jgi:hypothetical protein